MSAVDIINAYYNFTKGYLHSFARYKQTYYNYFFVAYQVLWHKYPISAKLRDGRRKLYTNQNEIWLDMANIRYSSKEDIVYLDGIQLIGATTNGDVVSVFAKKEYEWLPVKDKIVIDIGANIGDSSIYFASRGARKVYAFEPQPSLYELAQRNIELSDLLDIIHVTCARCSSETSDRTFPASFPLEEVIKRCTESPDCLKIDCEGCEYDIIMNSSDTVLSSIDYMIMEYHYGYKNLRQKLEQCGFSVKVSGPVYGKNYGPQSIGYSSTISDPHKKVSRRYVGYLYAKRSS
ncbi:MAG: FkbM family methyltransferase [Nitrososphaeraceae archaeon]